ncbi:MAG: tetratricopeptide repeat protein [Deltaproteobacteria bacterium]|nr:tetratricopeptide repeat protein [Deltaproteobacteria bacterium]
MRASPLASRTIPLTLVLIGILIYSNTLGGPFVLDDLLNIRDNPSIKDLKNFLDTSGTRYVAYLSFALNYSLGGLNPFTYHTANLLIHITNSLLVYLLVLALFETEPAQISNLSQQRTAIMAGITASIFLVHPLNTQAVSYITQRFTSLATFFYLLSLVLYLKARLKGSRLFYMLSVASALMAFKTKEISFTLPVIIMLLDIVFVRGETRVKKRALMIAPYILASLIIPFELILPELGIYSLGDKTAEFLRQSQITDLGTISAYEYLLTQLTVIPLYIKLFFAPTGLHFDYHYPVIEGIGARLIAYCVLLVLMLGTGIWLLFYSLRKKEFLLTLASAGILWFFITASIESSIIPLKDVISEHRTYLPNVGLSLSTVMLIFHLASRIQNRDIYPAVYVVFIFALSALSFASYQRNTVWSDDLRLYLDEVEKNTHEAPPYNYLGIAYLDRGLLNEASAAFKDAVRIDPGLASARKNLGLVLSALGETDAAIEEFKKLSELKPGYAGAHYNLGLMYDRKGWFEEAKKEFKETLRLNPKNKEAAAWLEKIAGD